MLQERQTFLTMIKGNLARAQNKMKQNRTFREFQVGELVLKLQPYAQSSVVSRPCAKLSFKFFGPFKVLQRSWIYLRVPKSIQYFTHLN
jgi:hypothetical protein